MDRAYEGNETRYLVQPLGSEPVVPPLESRLDPWSFDAELYKRRNEIERLFGRIKRFRRVFTRYDKTDLMLSAFVTVAFIADQLRKNNGLRLDAKASPEPAKRHALSASRPGRT